MKTRSLAHILLGFFILGCTGLEQTNFDYEFKICEDCNNKADIIAFEKKKGSIQISLTPEELGKVFKASSDTLSESTTQKEDLFSGFSPNLNIFYVYQDPKSSVREFTCYSFLRSLDMENEENAVFTGTAIKFFHEDPIIDKKAPRKYKNGFSCKELRYLYDRAKVKDSIIKEASARFYSIEKLASTEGEKHENCKDFMISFL